MNLKPIQSKWRKQIFLFLPYIIGGLIFVILPPLAPGHLQSILSKVIIFALFAMSLNLIWGYTGLLSLGHAAFFGVGAYVAGILTTSYGIESFWTSTAFSILVVLFLAAFFGVIALRVSGLYFLLVTLALGQLVYYVAVGWNEMTGGVNGTVGITWPDLSFAGFAWNSIYYYYFCLLIFIICFFLMYRIVKSPFGQALQGIRENEPRLISLGYNTWLYKYIIFIIGGVFAAVAGVLFAYFAKIVGPPQVGITTSSVVALMIIIGSTSVFWGPFVGALIIVLLEYFISLYLPARWPLILGALFIIAVIFLRGGISIHLSRLWKKVSDRYGST